MRYFMYFFMKPKLTLCMYGQLYSSDTDTVQTSRHMQCQWHLLNHTDKLKEIKDEIKQFTEE